MYTNTISTTYQMISQKENPELDIAERNEKPKNLKKTTPFRDNFKITRITSTFYMMIHYKSI